MALTDYYNSNPIENPNAQQDDKFMVLVSTDNGATWSAGNATIWNNSGDGNYVFNQISSTGEEINIPLSSYAGQTIKIAFYGESTASGGDNDLHIDNIYVGEAPNCSKPSQVVIDGVTTETIHLSWTENDSATSWQICINGDVNNLITVNTTSCTLTGLTPGTNYTVKVRAICGNEGYSSWSSIVSFITPLCEVSDQCEISYVLEDSYGDGWNGNAINVVDVATEEVLATLTIYDGSYEEGTLAVCNDRNIRFEWVYGNWSYECSYTVTDANGEVIFSGTGSMGSSVTYTVNCQVTSCPTPVNLVVSNVGFNSANLSWTENGSATSWQICLNGNENNLITVYTTSYTLVGLNPGTEYTVKVRANCGNEGYSGWSNTVSFISALCESPYNLKAVGTVVGNATISWQGSSDSYNLRYRLTGGGWTTVTGITDTTYTISGLALGNYEVEVAASCDLDDWAQATFSIMEVLSTENWYGYVGYVHSQDDSEWKDHFVSFSMQNLTAVTSSTEALYTSDGDSYTLAAAYANGYVWCITKDGNLCRAALDNNTKTISVFDTIILGFENTYSNSMSYNPVDGRMYYHIYSDRKLKSFDPAHPENVTEVGTYSINVITFAIDSAGEAYCIEISTGNLYHLNLNNASITFIGNTGHNANYAQSMAFDLETNELFWAQYYDDDNCGMYKVNLSTASTCYIGQIGGGNGAELVGLFMGDDFEIACPAPTALAVSEITTHSAALNWTGFSDSYNVRLGWNDPTTTLLNYDFENGSIPPQFVNNSAYAWTVVTDDIANSYYMKSGNAGVHSSSSAISITVTCPADDTIEFDAECKGEGLSTYYDHCDFFIDDTRVLYVGSNISGWNHYSFPVTSGTHTFTWSYTKDGSVNPTGDYFAVDNIVMGSTDIIWGDPVSVGDAEYTFSDLESGTLYYVTVQGVCDDDLSPETPVLSFITLPLCPAPIGLTATDFTASTATLSWTENGTATDWQICLNGDESNLIDVTTNPYTLTGLTPETAYIVKLRANCGMGDHSMWSNTVSFTTPEACPAPTNLTVALTQGDGSVATLSWTENGTATDWQICLNGDESNLINVTTNPYTLTGLTAETNYTAKVRTNCADINYISGWSNTVSFTPTDNNVIGFGDATNYYLPSYSFYNYTLSQQIYTAVEIGTAGTINSIAFYNGGPDKTRYYDMYLVHTDKETFANGYDWITVSDSDRVFSGEVTMVANEWTVFDIDGFDYDGTSNLALIMDDNTGSYTSSPHMACRVFDAPSRSIRVYSDGTNYDPTNPSGYSGTIMNVKNQIMIDITPNGENVCIRPATLEANDVTAHTAVLSWTLPRASAVQPLP